MRTDTATIKPNWTPAKLLSTKIEFVVHIMAGIDQTDEWGRRLYSILEPYWFMLVRQQKGFTTNPDEVDEMKSTIHLLDEFFCELRDQDGMQGWYYGISSLDNVGFALANLLIQIRNEMLIAIAKYMESRKFNGLSPETQAVQQVVLWQMDVRRDDSISIQDSVLAAKAGIKQSELPRVFKEIRQHNLFTWRQKRTGVEFHRVEPYWSIN